MNGRQFANTLRRTSLMLVHIRGSYLFVRERPYGRLVVVPTYPGETLPFPVVRSIMLHASITEQQTADLMYE
jgi:predicted RNA binding protein YcfA (HicA-like mRNA interferase family)